jgi:hypothetical protein
MPDLDYPVCQRHAVKIAAAVAAHVNDDSRIARMLLQTAWYPAVAQADGPVVYYVRIGDHIKIGYSRSVSERIKTFQTSNAVVELLACEAVTEWDSEAERHRRFADHRVKDRRELFEPGPELIQHINQIRALTGEEPIPGWETTTTVRR